MSFDKTIYIILYYIILLRIFHWNTKNRFLYCQKKKKTERGNEDFLFYREAKEKIRLEDQKRKCKRDRKIGQSRKSVGEAPMRDQGRKKRRKEIRRMERWGEESSRTRDQPRGKKAKRSTEIIPRPALVKVISGTRTLDPLAAQGQTPLSRLFHFFSFLINLCSPSTYRYL